ncbi:MAG: cell division protein ZapA [Deltaproteobacteria bacterium]|nr:cell division protein ZapA [Deltaproteobacteria bacterium]
MKKSLNIDVAGQRFTLKTDADEAYVRSLAQFVTEKIDEARQNAKAVTTQSLAILAAMNIADDLFQARRQQSDLKRRIRDKSHTILELLEKEAKLIGSSREPVHMTGESERQ